MLFQLRLPSRPLSVNNRLRHAEGGPASKPQSLSYARSFDSLHIVGTLRSSPKGECAKARMRAVDGTPASLEVLPSERQQAQLENARFPAHLGLDQARSPPRQITATLVCLPFPTPADRKPRLLSPRTLRRRHAIVSPGEIQTTPHVP
ncbi:uncharacterized protein PAN0_006d2849 [Moesziomyces antarcticus]|uniref:Uncharacterized protein n=2 Tax=Pseudozyma antarctica TaxID=84753 RepID=A0A5C3FQ31_PSEA2|nr:uncharacterized protein PAN0_006d2849 [Moesziomyces antarcticus]GAK64635.1 hypothetical protein PAN0_006d2849 [Moesziomyces antarcticus]SPO45617.1 uncharacterized protein PSANT_03303 [Moesziomyces antarcticus]